MSKEKKKKLTLKNFKGTPRKFNETNLKAKGKVLVERKNSTFKSCLLYTSDAADE